MNLKKYREVIPGDTMTVEEFVETAIDHGYSDSEIKDILDFVGRSDPDLGERPLRWDEFPLVYKD